MRLSIALSALVLVKLALTALSQWYIITQLGVGVELDALVAGFILPQFLITISGNSLLQVLVPLLTAQDEEVLHQNVWSCLLAVGGLFTAMALLLFASIGVLVDWLVPGFSAAGKSLTIDLTRIQLVSLVFAPSSLVLLSAYHARRRFIWAELSTLVSLMIGLLFLVWGLPRYGIYAAAYVVVLRAVLDFVLLTPIVRRLKNWSFHFSLLPEMWRRARYLLMGSAYFGTEPLINQALTSLAPAGSLALFYSAQQYYGLTHQVTQHAIAAPLLPRLAGEAKLGQWRAFRESYYARLKWMAAYMVIAFLLLLTVGEPVLQWVIGRSNVRPDDVHMLWLIMVAMSGLLTGGLAQVTVTGLFAMGDTRTSTYLGIVTYSLYLPIKLLVFLNYGVLGLAVATSLFFAMNLIGQFYFLEKATSGSMACVPKAYVKQ